MANSDVAEQVEAINERLRTQLFNKGVKGLKSLARTFKIADNSGNKQLDKDEFEEALQFAGLFLKADEISLLFKYFDVSGDGNISYDEFVLGLAPPLSARREALIKKVFAKLDKDASGVIDLEDVRGVYNAAEHPSVKKGEKTEEDILREYLNSLTSARDNNDGVVEYNEFYGYYRDLGASIPSDDYFVAMISNVWKVTEDGVEDPGDVRMKELMTTLREKVRQRMKGQDPKRDLKKTFQHFDSDESGQVDQKEFKKAMEKYGITLKKKELATFFKFFDADNSGSINYEEFGAALYGGK